MITGPNLGFLPPEYFEGRQYAGGGQVSAAVLPAVSDPEKAYADLTRQEYLDFVNNYGRFEEDLIRRAQTDTSLIDQAREDIGIASGLAQGVANRNAQRYGVALTPAQIQQQQLRLQRGNTLGGIQAMNDARLAQKDLNYKMLSDLINIGQGVNKTAQNQLGSAAQDASARANAYRNAKASSRAQTYQAVGSLAASAIMLMAF